MTKGSTLHSGPVVVGVADRMDNRPALRWAVGEAASRNARLRLVGAYTDEARSPRRGPTTTAADAPASMRRAVAASVEFAHAYGVVPVDGRTILGDPARVLIEESFGAALLVLGARGRGAMASTLFGSVSATVAGRAVCPVVVVRRGLESPSAYSGPVVVGVVGGGPTYAVLNFAFDYAARHGVALRAVRCREPTPDYGVRFVARRASEHNRAVHDLVELLGPWREEYPGVPVEFRVRRAPAVRGLVEESADAGLLVVGARGRHPMIDRMLGSVSQSVLRRAVCPVAVLHGPRRAVGEFVSAREERQ